MRLRGQGDLKPAEAFPMQTTSGNEDSRKVASMVILGLDKCIAAAYLAGNMPAIVPKKPNITSVIIGDGPECSLRIEYVPITFLVR
jgi:hypothetical protein